jgi:hypothetical protein
MNRLSNLTRRTDCTVCAYRSALIMYGDVYCRGKVLRVRNKAIVCLIPRQWSVDREKPAE